MPENAGEKPVKYMGEPEDMVSEERMVVPAVAEEPGEEENDAKGGGSIYTCAFSEGETRPQEMHSATRYQEETAQPGQKPKFYAYTDLTEARGEVR